MDNDGIRNIKVDSFDKFSRYEDEREGERTRRGQEKEKLQKRRKATVARGFNDRF